MWKAFYYFGQFSLKCPISHVCLLQTHTHPVTSGQLGFHFDCIAVCVHKCNWSVLFMNTPSYELHMKEQHVSRLNKSSSLPLLSRGIIRTEIISEMRACSLETHPFVLFKNDSVITADSVASSSEELVSVRRSKKQFRGIDTGILPNKGTVHQDNKYTQRTTSVSCQVPCTEKLCIKTTRTHFTESPY